MKPELALKLKHTFPPVLILRTVILSELHGEIVKWSVIYLN